MTIGTNDESGFFAHIGRNHRVYAPSIFILSMLVIVVLITWRLFFSETPTPSFEVSGSGQYTVFRGVESDHGIRTIIVGKSPKHSSWKIAVVLCDLSPPVGSQVTILSTTERNMDGGSWGKFVQCAN